VDNAKDVLVLVLKLPRYAGDGTMFVRHGIPCKFYYERTKYVEKYGNISEPITSAIMLMLGLTVPFTRIYPSRSYVCSFGVIIL